MKSFFVKEPHPTPILLIIPQSTIKEDTIYIDKLGVVYSCLFFCEFLLVGVGTHSIFFPNTGVKCFLMHGNKSSRQVVVKLSQWGQNSSAVCATNNAVCGKEFVRRICQKLKKKITIYLLGRC
jgi:hypothetical protein